MPTTKQQTFSKGAKEIKLIFLAPFFILILDFLENKKYN
jgi:hypothetical protein